MGDFIPHAHSNWISGRSRLLDPTASDGDRRGRGVGVIAGRDDLSVLAWSDVGPPAPKVHVYQYNQPQDIKTMQGRTYNFCLSHGRQLDLMEALGCRLSKARTVVNVVFYGPTHYNFILTLLAGMTNKTDSASLPLFEICIYIE